MDRVSHARRPMPIVLVCPGCGYRGAGCWVDDWRRRLWKLTTLTFHITSPIYGIRSYIRCPRTAWMVFILLELCWLARE